MDQKHTFQLTQKPSLSQRVFLTLMGSSIPTGGEIAPGITRLAPDYSTMYVLAVGEGKFVLIDSGNDKSAKEIIGFLASQNATPADVVAIFITHAHPDHLAGLKHFLNATVYASVHDREVLRGSAEYEGLLPRLAGVPKEPAVADVTHLQSVSDGQRVPIGDKQIAAFLVPGHTKGSLAFLIDDLLFVGDSVTFGKDKAIKPSALVSADAAQSVASLRSLIERFDTEDIAPRLVFPSHSGEGTLEAIRKLIN